MTSKLLFDSAEWNFEAIDRTWNAIDKIGKEVFGLDYYPPQIEVITSEQMLDGYSTVAMPVLYEHWSFGKSFIKNQQQYQQGQMGLAYEVVINTNPTLAYLLESNTMTMQTLVMAHAVCGHGSFFKNNYLFVEWTDADSILDYLQFAKEYIRQCEEKYSAEEVEKVLDACHALQYFSMDKYKRKSKLNKAKQEARAKKWDKYTEESFDILEYRTITKSSSKEPAIDKEENLLYYIEKNSKHLKPWQKEVCRIVRRISQYFFPQMQTQVMNEGWATFWHYTIMNHMWDEGMISDGNYIEFIRDHSAVVMQLPVDSKHYSGINPYALGFTMMMDIKRICESPTAEDIKWFPNLAGSDWLSTMKEIVVNFRDESFVLQYLSPKVIRDMKLCSIAQHEDVAFYTVTNIHRDEDVHEIRRVMSEQYSITRRLPQINVIPGDSEVLNLEYTSFDGVLLDYNNAKKTMAYAQALWGDAVELTYVDAEGKEVEVVK